MFQSLAPTYEKLAKAFEGENDVLIAKVDATEEEELGKRYNVEGFPTIKFFPAGSAEPEAYDVRMLILLYNYFYDLMFVCRVRVSWRAWWTSSTARRALSACRMETSCPLQAESPRWVRDRLLVDVYNE